jgi:hypothetical protein
MAATRRRSKRDLHVVVTESDGTVTSLLVARGGFNQIRKNPITGLGQVVTTGDNAARSDQRTPQVILSDPTGGMGEFFYTETQGITSFTDSDCDTRFPGMVVLPPQVTLLGAIAALGTNTTTPWHVEYVNETNATRIAWTAAAVSQRYTGAAWTTTSMPTGNGAAFFLFNGNYYLGTTTGLWYSANGTAWTQISFPPNSTIYGAVVHDNKVWVIHGMATASNLAIEVSTDGTTFTFLRFFDLTPGEVMTGLLEWRDRVGRAVLYVRTNQRLIQYDEDADQFLNFYQFARRPASAAATGWAEPWQRDGNLYAILGSAARPDNVYVFSGTTGRYGPNLRGGLPNASRSLVWLLRGGDNWLYFWGTTRASPATATLGRVMAMNDQGAFHTLMPGFVGGTISGGGYDEGLLWAVTTAGSVYEMAVPDTTDLPLYVTAGERTYDTTATRNHEYAFTDGGTPLMNKQWLWVTVTCLDHTSANKVPGLATNTSVVVQYRRDVDTAWTTLGTLTSADAFPKVLPIASGFGVQAKQLKVRLQLATSTANNTPVVTSVALAYTRQEVPRYAYTVPIDLTDRAHPLYRGKSVAGLLAAMDRWTQPGALVKLQFAGGDAATSPSTGTTVQNATFAYSGAEDAERGPGVYQGIFADFTSPSSG